MQVKNILEVIRPGCLQEAQPQNAKLLEAQHFLEICLSQDCPNSRFREFLGELSSYINKGYSFVKEKFINLIDVLVDLTELESQIQIQLSQLHLFVPSDLSEDSDSFSLSGFDAELFTSYYESCVESITEYNLYLSKSVLIYWLYFPTELQECIKDYVEKQKFRKVLDILSLEILEDYQKSVGNLKNSISEVAKNELGSPKISLSKLSSDFVKEPPSASYVYSSPASKSYTLEDMLHKITPESRHDTISWDEPIGKEIW